MTNKEREKFFTQTIKALSKKEKWKFKSYFTFKQVGDLFFESYFWFNPKTNSIYGRLGYKPYSIDDRFWELTEMPENSKRPMSFRAEAAFRVHSFEIFEYDLKIKNTEKPEKEIQSLLNQINKKVNQVTTKGVTVEDFLHLLEKDNDRNHSVEILTCLIELKDYKKALQKIEFFRKNNIRSGYGFEGRDFFDLVEKTCTEKLSNQ